MDRILPIKSYKKYSRVKRIGAYTHRKCLYKYLSLSSFKKCLKNNTLMFQRPIKWKDPFEARFYNANYGNIPNAKGVNKEFFACCFTKNTSCEAAWRMYSENYKKDPCIQICLAIGQVRNFLNRFAESHNAMVYEGNIRYDLADKEISTLHLTTNNYHDLYFEDFTLEKYLNLMLIKRQAFEYEGEIRYFIYGGKYQIQRSPIFIHIPWCRCMNNIKLPFDINLKQKKEIDDILKANLSLCKQEDPNSYPQMPKIIYNELYKPFEKITIESI